MLIKQHKTTAYTTNNQQQGWMDEKKKYSNDNNPLIKNCKWRCIVVCGEQKKPQ
jgi:hypothetical protein